MDDWWDTPISDDWSDVSNLEGYDPSGNWTGMGSSGGSLFGDFYGGGEIPNTVIDWDNYLGSGISNIPSQFPDMTGYDEMGNWQGFQGGMSQFVPQEVASPPPSTAGSMENVLGQLFSNPNLLAKGIGALFEGQQNKKMSRNLNAIAQRAPFDPFGSQRPYYQEALRGTVENPYSAPIVRDQVDQLAKAQAIKDAAAGRRSNSLTSAPALIAAQAKVAQDYMNSLMHPAGAYINPNAGGLASLLGQGAKYDVNSGISPLLQVLGDYTRGNENQAILEKLLKGK